MMMILGSQSGVFELRLTGERSLQIITQDYRKAGDVNNGRLYFNLSTKISSSQNWPKSSSDLKTKKKMKLFG